MLNKWKIKQLYICKARLLCGAVLFLVCGSAFGADEGKDFDLFSLKTENWISSDSLNKTQSAPYSSSPQAYENGDEEIPVQNTLKSKDDFEVNKGFDMSVGTTQEDDEKQDQSAPEDLAGPALQDRDWKPLKDIITRPSTAKQAGEYDATPPLTVRKSFLPSLRITPTPSPTHESAVKKGHDYFRKLTEKNYKKKEKPKTPEEAAACAALDAYKKRQLDALQSDRQTLKALQNAIRSLGLSAQLDFMTEPDSALGVPQVGAATGPSSPLSSSSPPPASTTAKEPPFTEGQNSLNVPQ